MPSFTIKVPNDDEGENLGEYQSDYLPRVGDPFVLWHPRVCRKDEPFCGVVSMVTHEASRLEVDEKKITESHVQTTVWLVEEHAAPTLYCDCSNRERETHGVTDGQCDNCGHARDA